MKMSEQINELATALVIAQGLIHNPTKSVSNAFFKSKYADLAGVIDVCRPAFTEAGIAVIQAPSTTDDGSIAVTTTLVHTSGQWMSEQISMAIDPGAKNPAQAAGSLITYLRRYSLSAFANVAQEDDDGNSLKVAEPARIQPSSITDKQVQQIKSLLDEGEAGSEEKFLAAYKISSLSEVPATSFDKLCQTIKSRNDKMGAS
tara:strand:+ start:240 stop:845 length:606 start_codon:yes stop_codon:yes gene_type:complete